MRRLPLNWQNEQTQNGITYDCGFCGTNTTPSKGWHTANGPERAFILICTKCNRPSFVHTFNQEVKSTTPAARIGRDILGLPEKIDLLYNEARKCTSVGAYTSAVLTCRKILMHIAVEKGADEGIKFIEYVKFLEDNNFIPPDGKEWVDHIRSKANEANHEITILSLTDADDLLTFTEMLLRLVFEFKHRLSKDENNIELNLLVRKMTTQNI